MQHFICFLLYAWHIDITFVSNIAIKVVFYGSVEEGLNRILTTSSHYQNLPNSSNATTLSPRNHVHVLLIFKHIMLLCVHQEDNLPLGLSTICYLLSCFNLMAKLLLLLLHICWVQLSLYSCHVDFPAFFCSKLRCSHLFHHF